MKSKLKIKGLNEQRPKQQKKKGVALLTVLTVMSLATILVLTFFTMAQNELESATSYAHGMEARHLSETAVNMVIAQIRRGSTDNNNTKRNYAWATQPGGIRVYGQGGVFKTGYKLYSDDEMVVGSEKDFVNKDAKGINTWSTNTAEYVDMNEPVIRANKVYFPIVDTRAKDVLGVEGFDYNLNKSSANVSWSVEPSPLEPAAKQANDNVLRTLPMPVKWLYQLKDGTMGHMTGRGGQGDYSPLGGGPMPTTKNPIVGRVAFWTDDECAKLNVNTAAGGMVWDTPRTGGDIDRAFGKFQPAQHEWQRYPGHPATTSLAPVFFPGVSDINFNRDAMGLLYKLTPRVVGGGSRAGSAKPTEPNGLVPDKDRLYPSLDEFVLRPGNKAGTGGVDSVGTRIDNVFPLSEMKVQRVDQLLGYARFFLTATSKAPEVTLFNTPRVAIWPTYYKRSQSDEKYVTAFDNLIRFTGELGKNNASSSVYDRRYQYYFQRKNADSSTDDMDPTKTPRNIDIYMYLDRMMKASAVTPNDIPGFQGNFAAKYGNANQEQLLTEIFDYIRSTNLFDDTVNVTKSNPNGWKDAFTQLNSNQHLTFTNYRIGENNSRGIHMGHGQVTPITVKIGGRPDTKGFGRFYSIVEVGVHLICNSDGDPQPSMAIGGRAAPATNDRDFSKKIGGGGDNGVPWPENGSIAYSNFPPLPDGAKLPSDPWATDGANLPQWLIKLNKKDPLKAQAAIRPENWNFMLALGDKAKLNEVNGVWYAKNVNVAHQMRLYPRSPAFALTQAEFNMGVFNGPADLGPQGPEKVVQAALWFKMFTPSQGWVPISPDFKFSVAGSENLIFGGGAKFLNPANPYKMDGAPTWVANGKTFANLWGGKHSGGHGGFRSLLVGTSGSPLSTTYPRMAPFDFDPKGRNSNPKKSEAYNIYPWMTQPFKITGKTVAFQGAPIKIRLYSSVGATSGDLQKYSSPQSASPELVQTVEINLAALGAALPAPSLAAGLRERIDEWGRLAPPESSPKLFWSLSYDGAFRNASGTPATGRLSRALSSPNHMGRIIREGDTCWSMGVPHGDFRLSAVRLNTAGALFKPNPLVGQTSALGGIERMAHTFTTASGAHVAGTARIEGTSGLEPKNALVWFPSTTRHGRPATALWDLGKKWNLYGDFDNGVGNYQDGPYINKADEGNTTSMVRRIAQAPKSAYDMVADYGEFPYFARPWVHEAGGPGYFSPNRIMPGPGVFGSLPTEAISSSEPNQGAWQTLLFRPDVGTNPSYGYRPHPGAKGSNPNRVKDHLLMDLFWMPVVEPYAISETLSTAGKINMNYQILPFSYIKRNTGLRGVFKSEVMMTVPNAHAKDYKVGYGRGVGYHWKYDKYGGSLQRRSMRTFIRADRTLQQFDDKFDGKFSSSGTPEIFKSATQICDIHLVPIDIAEAGGYRNGSGVKTPTVNDMASGKFMRDVAVVGDNARERPYADIYPRLTTKSNTFKVHFRAQVLRKSKVGPNGQGGATWAKTWNSEYDQPVGEYRGSTVVERYIDPNDPNLDGQDYATNSNLGPIDQFYKYRVLNTRRFAP